MIPSLIHREQFIPQASWHPTRRHTFLYNRSAPWNLPFANIQHCPRTGMWGQNSSVKFILYSTLSQVNLNVSLDLSKPQFPYLEWEKDFKLLKYFRRLNEMTQEKVCVNSSLQMLLLGLSLLQSVIMTAATISDTTTMITEIIRTLDQISPEDSYLSPFVWTVKYHRVMQLATSSPLEIPGRPIIWCTLSEQENVGEEIFSSAAYLRFSARAL